jgi:cystathionine gamma-synthase
MTADQSADPIAERPLAPATLAVVAGRPEPVMDAPLNPPVVLASTYQAADAVPDPAALTYGRWANPTWAAFERALGHLEGGEAVLFGSGVAAMAATLEHVPPGGPVVAPRTAYSGLSSLLTDLAAQGRIQPRLVDIADTPAVLEALDGAAMLWVETPTNPLLEIADTPALTAAGRRGGALVVVDNTFATPLGMRPLTMGADLAVHSVTKYLSGHSDVVLGAVVAADPDLAATLRGARTLRGAVPGPMESWLALRGLRTLHVRVERACGNAAELARRLVGHPRLERVRHPSLPEHPGHERAAAQMRTFGAIISIEVRGGAEAAEQVVSALRLWRHATSLGGVESTLERRRRYASEPAEVPEGLLRLSVGIEDVDDLWRDLDEALRAAG